MSRVPCVRIYVVVAYFERHSYQLLVYSCSDPRLTYRRNMAACVRCNGLVIRKANQLKSTTRITSVIIRIFNIALASNSPGTPADSTFSLIEVFEHILVV